MPITLVDLLRSANESLRDYLDRLSCREPSPTAVELQSLSDSIERVGQAWREAAPPGNLDQALEAEIASYSENLRRLKSLLEGLRPELEQRRAELHSRLTQLQAALRWAATLKQTR
jgi:DNA repair exonuclease SbcCD ATPase subunit